MFDTKFNSIIEITQLFRDEAICIEYLELMRWSDGVVSPFDSTSKVYKCKNGKYRCKNTGKYFNVKTGTLFDNTKIPLQKWFLAIWLVTSHKKGVSSLQLSRDIDVTQKSSWFMIKRIQNCFGVENNNILDGDCEADESYIHGKNKNRHAHKKIKDSQGRSPKGKAIVFGTIQRGGKLNARKVSDVRAQTLTKEIIQDIKSSANLYTDEWLGYNSVNKIYNHFIVKHNAGEYVRGDAHTNTIEGVWSILKRVIFGIHHSVSKKHLQLYIDSVVFRYNTRKLSEQAKINILLQNTSYRLKYDDLIRKD